MHRLLILGALLAAACSAPIEMAAVAPTAPVEAQRIDRYKTLDLLGIQPAEVAALRAVGITRAEALLEAAATRLGRAHLAARTGLATSDLLHWANMADLMRITGVGPEYSHLLEKAGVDTVMELRHRNPNELAGTLRQLNERFRFVNRLPSAATVNRWISDANTKPRKMEY